MTPVIPLDFLDLALALALMGGAIALSLWQRLDLSQNLLMATGRAILQLMAAGAILDLVFALNQPWSVVAIALAMLTIAAITAHNQIDTPGFNLLPTLWLSLFASTALTLSYALIVIIQPPTWYSPQYFIPLAGMVLGNAMNAATIAGERLLTTVRRNPVEILTHLSLGATPQQAIATYRRDAIRASLLPLINRMTVVGLVTLPGMFTGQVLGGSPPLEAASYQLLILFMVACAEAMAAIAITLGMSRHLFNAQSQLIRLDPH
ncbi:ABC transporter permease [Spirulina major]|uniref:ABC transporter permease n=1 Tax=Spirulina major TaxID=270636 RepID=UPI000933B7DB|nr:iron export ABC transporter permease subunit FetB [Spirulina major]